ncbi:B12-binding domain-containing protein [Aeromicrobium sp. Leaf350]|uniref:MerR family transcriptional regulator n=1 Tax=Aeromicrobium sp. Leaf350 TaxID=2876565 RepID=UPI001E4083AB|nr:B12-binding domain-containing protein [Aeromicrobium sp. Leaf350]
MGDAVTGSDRTPRDQGLRIREASELLGVPAVTLRSWELRYGLPMTLRSDGGHRRYTEAALIQLGLMRDEIATGQQASDAAQRVRVLLDELSPARARIDAVMAGSDRRDSSEIEAVLQESLDDRGLAATLDEVVLPAMRQIGSWWESGRCDVAQEQFTTAVVRGWLARMTTLAPPAASGQQVLLATGPRDMHTLGIEALGAVLRTQGTGCRVLGARTSLRDLAAAVSATEPAAVVIVSHLSTQRRSAIESLISVSHAECLTFYCGNAFLSPRSRQQVPGVYLGERMVEAASLIQRAVPLALPSYAPEAG